MEKQEAVDANHFKSSTRSVKRRAIRSANRSTQNLAYHHYRPPTATDIARALGNAQPLSFSMFLLPVAR
jgi:hypothetical protein